MICGLGNGGAQVLMKSLREGTVLFRLLKVAAKGSWLCGVLV